MVVVEGSSLVDVGVASERQEQAGDNVGHRANPLAHE